MDMIIDIVLLATRVFVGLVLIAAGWSKLTAPSSHFVEAILAYDLVPRSIARMLAAILPRLEIVLGVAMLAGLWIPVTASAAYAVVFVLTTAVVASLARGRRHFCGCLGFTGGEVREVQWSLVQRNVVLLGACALAATVGDPYRLDRWLTDSPLGMPRQGTTVLVLGAVLMAAACMLGRLRAASLEPG